MDQKIFFQKQVATKKNQVIFMQSEGSLPYKQNIGIKTYLEKLNSEF
jgi:hypothetical protein